MTKNKLLIEFERQLSKSIINQYQHFFDICYEEFKNILNVSLHDSDPVNDELIFQLLESFTKYIESKIQQITFSIYKKSANDIFNDLKQHIRTLQDELKNILLKNAPLDKVELNTFYDNIQRVKSFYNLSSAEIDLIQMFDESSINDVDILQQLDQEFKSFLIENFKNLKLGLFKEEYTDNFYLLSNKIEIFQSNLHSQLWFPSSKQTLDDLKQDIKSGIIEKLQQFKKDKNNYFETKNYQKIQTILESLYFGDIQTRNIFTDYDSVHRDYSELFNNVTLFIQNISDTLLREVRTDPFSTNAYERVINHSQEEESNIFVELEEKLKTFNVINQFGYYNLQWDGKISFTGSRLQQYSNEIENIIQSKIAEYEKHIINITPSLFEYLNDLSQFVWFDDFCHRINTLPLSNRFKISNILDLVKEGCEWRFDTLLKDLEHLISNNKSDANIIHQNVTDLISIHNFSQTITNNCNLTTVANLYQGWVYKYCDNIKIKLNVVVDSNSCANKFPYKELEEFLRIRNSIKELVIQLLLNSEVIDYLDSVENESVDLMNRYIVLPSQKRPILSIDFSIILDALNCYDNLQNYSPSFLSLINQPTGQDISIIKCLKSEVNDLIHLLQQLIGSKNDIPQMEQQILILERCIPFDKFINENISRQYTFLYGQIILLQSTVQEEMKEKINKSDFTNIREYLDKFNIPDNPPVYQKYTELLNLIGSNIKLLLKELQGVEKDGASISSGLARLDQIWMNLGGYEGKYDHISNSCNIDIQGEIIKINDRITEFIDSELANLHNYKDHQLEIAVKAANSLIKFNEHLNRENLTNTINKFISILRDYLVWDGISPSKEKSLGE